MAPSHNPASAIVLVGAGVQEQLGLSSGLVGRKLKPCLESLLPTSFSEKGWRAPADESGSWLRNSLRKSSTVEVEGTVTLQVEMILQPPLLGKSSCTVIVHPAATFMLPVSFSLLFP